MKPLFLSIDAWGRMLRLLASYPRFWACIFVVAGAWYLGCVLGEIYDNERADGIRYSGWLLEICGLFSVAVGLNRKLKVFHGLTIWPLLKKGLDNFIKQLPFIRRRVVIQGTAGIVFATGARVSGQGTSRISRDRPMEDQVAFLLKRNDEITDGIFKLHDADRAIEDKLTAELNDLRAVLQAELARADTKLEKAHEVGWESVGLIWIFAGVTLATVPDLIVSLVS
ncbi:MAG: hypothetical protein WD795_16480 [Woeseia sp.]